MKRCSLPSLATGWLLLLGFVSPNLLLAAPDTDTASCGLCYATSTDGQRIVVPLESTEVVLDVQPGLLEAQVTQTFTNRTRDALEATYLYPLPADATITQFELHFRDRVIQSVVREKMQAKVEYETAKMEGRKAALLEQHDPSLFSTAVANFLPGETVKVVIRYIQPVALRANGAEIRFPMTTGVKYFPASSSPGTPGNSAPTPPKVAASAVDVHHFYAYDILVNGFPDCAIGSASHAVRVEQLPGGRNRVGLAEEITIPDRDFLLSIETANADAPASTVVMQRTVNGSFGMLTVFPPQIRPASTKEQPARDILFLIDRSGSMDGPRFASAKLGLRSCLAMLESKDRFQIVPFESSYSFYQPHWTTADGAGLALADDYVGTLQVAGGTMMQPALAASLDFFAANASEREQVIVFLTDGDVGNEGELLNLLEAKIGRVRLFTFGIGAAPNAFLISKMAELGRGQARFIANDDAIAKELSDLFATLASPVLTDLQLTLLDAAGTPLDATVFPQTLGDVFMARPAQAVFAVGVGEPTAVLLEARSDGKAVRVRLPLDGMQLRGDGLAQHFGRMLYTDLAAQQRAVIGSKQRTEELRQQMLETAVSFQLVTELTSRVAVDRVVARDPKVALSSTTVAQYGAADQSAVIGADGVIVLSPFEVQSSEDTGYVAADTLCGTRLRSDQDFGSAASVVTKQLLEDIGLRRLEDAVSAMGEPVEHPLFAKTGYEAGLLDGLPVATVIDPAAVERITVQAIGPALSELSLRRASFRRSALAEIGFGDAGATGMAVAVNTVGESDHWAGLGLVSHSADEHDRWNVLLDGRLKSGAMDLRAGGQWNRWEDYGQKSLGRVEGTFGDGSGVQLHVVGGWHRLKRDDAMQFRRDSATAHYDGLGFFNLELLTAPVTALEDCFVQADVGGSMRGWGRHNWVIGVQWHQQDLDWVSSAAEGVRVLENRTLGIVADERVSFGGNRVSLKTHLGWTRHETAGMTIGADETATGSFGGALEVTRAFHLFAEYGHEEVSPALPSGEWLATDGDQLAVSLPTERRDSVQIGVKMSLLDNRVAGTFGLYREVVNEGSYRDWGWEAAHQGIVATTGGWIDPIRYNVCERLTRAGWRTEWTFQPLRNLTAKFQWYEDLRNEGPVRGGNHRGFLQTRYDFDCGLLKDFSVGGGFEYRNAVRFNDDYRLGGGLNWNLQLGYEVRVFGSARTTVRLTLRNLGGNEYQPTRFAHDRGRQLLVRVSQEF